MVSCIKSPKYSNKALYELSDSIKPSKPSPQQDISLTRKQGGILAEAKLRSQAFPDSPGMDEPKYRLLEVTVCSLIVLLQKDYMSDWLLTHKETLSLQTSPSSIIAEIDSLLAQEEFADTLARVVPPKTERAPQPLSTVSESAPVVTDPSVSKSDGEPSLQLPLGEGQARKLHSARNSRLKAASTTYHDIVYVSMVRPSTQKIPNDMLSTMRYCAGLVAAWELKDEVSRSWRSVHSMSLLLGIFVHDLSVLVVTHWSSSPFHRLTTCNYVVDSLKNSCCLCRRAWKWCFPTW